MIEFFFYINLLDFVFQIGYNTDEVYSLKHTTDLFENRKKKP